MKTFLLASTVALVSLFAAAGARAEVRTHPAAKVSFDTPSGWKIDDETESSMTITDPKEDIAFFLIVLDTSDLTKALESIDEEMGKSFKDVKWEDDAKSDKLNGMDVMSLDGAAKVEGKAVDLGVLLVSTPAKKVLLVVGAVDHAKAKQFDKTVTAFVKSIKPAR